MTIIEVGRSDKAMVRYGLIFEVEPVATNPKITNDQVERVDCDSELLGHGLWLRHTNGVGRLRCSVWHGHRYGRRLLSKSS